MSVPFPGKQEFIENSSKFNVIPLFREIVSDMETPVSAYRMISEKIGGQGFLLESVEGGEKWGRYSFIGFSPIASIISGNGEVVTRVGENEEIVKSTDPLRELKKLMDRFSYLIPADLPRLSCGAVGYIGYDYVRHIEKLQDRTNKGHSYPDFYFIIPSFVIAFDNLLQKTKVIKNVHIAGNMDPDVLYEENLSELDDLVSMMKQRKEDRSEDLMEPKEGELDLRAHIDNGELAEIIRKTRDYIKGGEAIQVVISNRYSCNYSGDPFDVYRALRVINPSPYMFFIDGNGVKVAGSSPEVLVRLDGSDIILRPIAGTRPRGITEEEDSTLENDLLSDPKELSEHLMLVDLGRNDLGRVSSAGSVKVNEFMVIERYSHVMHIVSNITSSLEGGMDAFEVMKATFPAGTVTGAPKVRAMEIIEEFESEKRGIYAGAVGYFDFSGNMDFCIAIRTIIFDGKRADVQAGAGIVFDSDPLREIEEIDDKAKAMREALKWGLKR